MSFRFLLLSAALSLTLACGKAETPTAPALSETPQLEGDFVMVRKDALSSSSPAIGRNTNDARDSFYIAIKKSELKQPYFLSAYLTGLFPRTSPGYVTLGTRVVSFEVQNDKLFVFDVDKRKKTSDVSDPTVVVEAYPIVRGWTQFFALPNAQDYVLIDPASGLNRFDIVADGFSSPTGLGRFQVDLAYSKNYKTLNDGVSFEQAFTGHGELANAQNDQTLEYNPYRYSGSVHMSFRKYSEGAGFVPSPLPSKTFYFTSDTRLVANQTATEENPVKWNVSGKNKITWKIGRAVENLQKDPRFASVRIFKAIADGVTNWNSVFGREVLEAKLASPSESAGDDNVNFLVVDPDLTFSYAFANWRSNPNTGEIRGASVYFNAIWLDIGDLVFQDDPAAFTAQAEALLKKLDGLGNNAPSLAWAGMAPQQVCDTDARKMLADLIERGPATEAVMAGATKAEKIERFVTHVLLHEIGHTLGLRHNFKGSLVGPSTSVMEYSLNEDSIFVYEPQSYDIAAIKWLYADSKVEPTDAFCTDQDTRVDPSCTQFDKTASPLDQYDAVNYTAVANSFVTGGAGFPNTTLNNLLKWVRAAPSTPAQKLQAWNFIMAPINNPPMGSIAARADLLFRAIVNRAYFDLPTARGNFTADPVVTDSALTFITDDLRTQLVNAANNRSFPTRRVAVDALKKQQTLRAYQALLDARAAVTTARATQTGIEAALSDDLLGRINVAVTPYFIK